MDAFLLSFGVILLAEGGRTSRPTQTHLGSLRTFASTRPRQAGR